MKPSLEQVWTTHRWPVRVFSFLLAVLEVNTYLAFKYFVWNSDEKMDFMTFRSKLAWSMINNMYLKDEESPDTRGRKKKRLNEHKWETAPPHAKFFCQNKWNLTCSQRFQQHRCSVSGCNKRTRKYCKCNIGEWLCESHYCEHIMNAT